MSGRKSVLASKVLGTANIAQETLSNKVSCLHLFQCFLETGDDHLVQLVGSYLSENSIDLSGNALLLSDVYTFCFFLTQSATKTWNSLNLSRCYIGDNGLGEFHRICTGNTETKISIKYINLSFNHLTSSVIDKIIDLCYTLKVERLAVGSNTITYQAFDDIVFAKYVTVQRATKIHVEKILNFKSSFYFIYTKFNRKEDMKLLCATNGDCSLYFWNSGFQLNDLPVVIGYIFANFSLVSVYETDLQDHAASEISSGLQKFIAKGTLVNIEYILQSKTKLLAYNSNMQKVSQACKYFLMQHHANQIDDLVTIKLMNCKIGDENFKVLISCMTEQNQNLFFDVFDISQCNPTNSALNTILETLEHCLIKHLNVKNNTIPNKILCDAILAKINVESNFF